MKEAVPSCLGAALAASASLFSGVASATPKVPITPIDLHVMNCPDIASGELGRLLAVELTGGSTDNPSPDGQVVVVDCQHADAPRIATISIATPTPQPIRSRAIDLDDVPPEHRPRVVALAIVELMSEKSGVGPKGASSFEENQRTPPPVRPTATDGSSDADAIAKRAPWRFAVGAMTLRSPGLDEFLWGGMAKAGFIFSDRFVGEVDFASVGNTVHVSLGSARIFVATAGATALAQVRLGRIEWDSGLGVRGGIVRLSGTPDNHRSTPGVSVESRTLVEPWGGPFVTTRLVAATGRHVFFVMGIEGGCSVTEVVGRVDGAAEVAITPLWAALSLGLGWSP